MGRLIWDLMQMSGALLVFFAFLPMTRGSKGKGREIGKRGDVFVRFFYRVREVLWRRNIFFFWGCFLALV